VEARKAEWRTRWAGICGIAASAIGMRRAVVGPAVRRYGKISCGKAGLIRGQVFGRCETPHRR
jgi:hypothetical protein